MKTMFAKISLALCLTVLVTSAAFAAPVIEWAYNVSYDFTYWENQYGNQDGITYNAADTDPIYGQASTSLSWGTFGTSSIGFIEKSGTVLTDGPAAIIEKNIYHENKPIDSESYFLQYGVVSATLTLQGIDPVTGSVESFSTVLNFLFFETNNDEPYANDVFVLLNPSAATESFVYDGMAYTFSFASNLTALDTSYLNNARYGSQSVSQALAGLGYDMSQPVIGWMTPENMTSYTDSYLTVVSTPEPSTFLIFGLGIAGLAIFRRKMNK